MPAAVAGRVGPRCPHRPARSVQIRRVHDYLGDHCCAAVGRRVPTAVATAK